MMFARENIAMDQPLRMCGGPGPGGLHADAQHLTNVQRALLGQSALQGHAARVGHDQVRHALPIGDVVDGHDVVVNDCGSRLRFPGQNRRRAAPTTARCGRSILIAT
jgi:hypothetical protein